MFRQYSANITWLAGCTVVLKYKKLFADVAATQDSTLQHKTSLPYSVALQNVIRTRNLYNLETQIVPQNRLGFSIDLRREAHQ